MRISDWSSDVCSSDLPATRGARKSALLRIEKGVDVAIGMIAPCPAIQVLHGTTNKHSVIIGRQGELRSEEHTSELQSLMRISYAVFCLKKKKYNQTNDKPNTTYTTIYANTTTSKI